MINNLLSNLEEVKSARDLLLTFDKAISRKLQLNSNASLQILAANSNRAYAAIINISDSPVTLHFGEGNAIDRQGILLLTKGSSFELTQFNLFTGRIAATSPNSAELSIVECSF